MKELPSEAQQQQGNRPLKRSTVLGGSRVCTACPSDISEVDSGVGCPARETFHLIVTASLWSTAWDQTAEYSPSQGTPVPLKAQARHPAGLPATSWATFLGWLRSGDCISQLTRGLDKKGHSSQLIQLLDTCGCPLCAWPVGAQPALEPCRLVPCYPQLL